MSMYRERSSNKIINRHVNRKLDTARRLLGIKPGATVSWGKRLRLVYTISKLGLPRGGGILSSLKSAFSMNAKYSKTAIEKWAAKNLPNKAPGGKYSAILRVAPTIRAFRFGVAWYVGESAINPSIVLNTANGQKVAVGTDKLGHFFAQGYEAFDISVIKGKGDSATRKKSVMTEKGKYGMRTTGVYSDADHRANMAGLGFYKDLLRNPHMKFDIGKYATKMWNEDINKNKYSKAVRNAMRRGSRSILPRLLLRGPFPKGLLRKARRFYRRIAPPWLNLW